MRKYNNHYYFIYSSFVNHELCYAISDYPDHGFVYGGVLVSNCDEGLGDKKTNYYGNNHGSILELNGNYYIFYHRQTNKNSFSRQMCAEKLKYDGLHFSQAEITSCGLNNGPLIGKGKYKASIACNLYSDKGTFFYKVLRRWAPSHAYLTQEREDNEDKETQYIKNISKHTIIGYKYFDFSRPVTKISVEVKSSFSGEVIVSDKDGGQVLGKIKVTPSHGRKVFSGTFNPPNSVSGLFFTFKGRGKLSLYSFDIE